ncbi:epoxide hydrolase [Streptomyces variegatus]|uniref:Epoxide hydrolase n=1 Tax=Streptomyces variegatus TaxID=284040 RepID=A0A0M2GUH6_9ACTN|nr:MULTISPECIES: alpha/beta hydrolase [Streptomyces]KJK39115.1 epoxide hydrolase [Streptomyces variegatus]
MIDVNGIQLHIAEQGEGPLVVLLHGFPESWHSWRHQFGPLAEAGFRVVAPDQRGYGGSDRPEDVAAYSILHLVGDVVGLIHALGEEQAFVVGHDWGAPVAWHTALLRPDVVRGVAGLSVPPPFRGDRPPLETMRERFEGRFYWNYFSLPGAADAEFAADTRTTLRKLLYSASGDAPDAGRPEQALVDDLERGWLADAPNPEVLPEWLTEEDLDVLAESFEPGFTGALNWYRNLDRNWELTAPWQGAVVSPPALYVYGDRDLVPAFPGTPELIERLPELMPNLRKPLVLPGCGHWTQQERPTEVNEALIGFLTELRD